MNCPCGAGERQPVGASCTPGREEISAAPNVLVGGELPRSGIAWTRGGQIMDAPGETKSAPSSAAEGGSVGSAGREARTGVVRPSGRSVGGRDSDAGMGRDTGYVRPRSADFCASGGVSRRHAVKRPPRWWTPWRRPACGDPVSAGDRRMCPRMTGSGSDDLLLAHRVTRWAVRWTVAFSSVTALVFAAGGLVSAVGAGGDLAGLPGHLVALMPGQVP